MSNSYIYTFFLEMHLFYISLQFRVIKKHLLEVIHMQQSENRDSKLHGHWL